MIQPQTYHPLELKKKMSITTNNGTKCFFWTPCICLLLTYTFHLKSGVTFHDGSAFDSADVLSLQDPSAALGPTLLRTDQLVLAPGGSGTLDIPIVAGATAFGIVAGFRDASGKTFRAIKALPASGNASFNITVSSAGLTVS